MGAELSRQKVRIEYLDVARGITILMIVAFHVLGETHLLYHHFVATMGLQIFLFVTGYFYRGFNIRKNIKKLVIPYIALLVFVRLFWDVKLRLFSISQIKDILKQIVLGYTIDETWQGNGFFVGIAWFLPLLVSVRLVYAVICKAAHKDMAKKAFWALAVSCVGIVIGGYGIKLPWSIDVAMATIIFTFWGDAAHQYHNQSKQIFGNVWIVLAALLMWWGMQRCYGISELATRNYPHGLTFLCVSFFSTIVVLGISVWIERYLPKVSKVFAFYGKYSFAVLCAHVIDKSCLVHSPETNIYLLTIWELFLASVPVIVMAAYHWVKGRKCRVTEE